MSAHDRAQSVPGMRRPSPRRRWGAGETVLGNEDCVPVEHEPDAPEPDAVEIADLLGDVEEGVGVLLDGGKVGREFVHLSESFPRPSWRIGCRAERGEFLAVDVDVEGRGLEEREQDRGAARGRGGSPGHVWQ